MYMYTYILDLTQNISVLYLDNLQTKNIIHVLMHLVVRLWFRLHLLQLKLHPHFAGPDLAL